MRMLWAIGFSTIAGCSHGRFDESCDVDQDCEEDLKCLVVVNDCTVTHDHVCSKTCETDGDCYRLGAEHCELDCLGDGRCI